MLASCSTQDADAIFNNTNHCISGAHGSPLGKIESVDPAMFQADVIRFGSYPDVAVHNFFNLGADVLKQLLNG